MNYTVHGILQARILKWVAVPFSRKLGRKPPIGNLPLPWDWLVCYLVFFVSSSTVSIPDIFSQKRAATEVEILVQFNSVTQSWPTLCNPMDCSMPCFPVHHQLLELDQTHICWVNDAIQSSHLILCHLLLLLPSIFPSIRVFSIESALCISWPKH